MAYAQGSVVLAPATFKTGIRPYLIVSNENRLFYGNRYVSPWSLHVFPDQEIRKRVAQVDEMTMRRVADTIHELTKVI